MHSLVLTIVLHEPYVVAAGSVKDESFLHSYSSLYRSMSLSYLPLLEMFSACDREGLAFSCALVLSPTLCSVLSDSRVMEGYEIWLERLIRTHEEASLRGEALAEQKRAEVARIKDLFVHTYDRNLVSAFAALSESGRIELLGSAATFAFLPHYADMPEVLSAQIEVGLRSHRHFFGERPAGFWLPYAGFAPDLERYLRSYGIIYTVLDDKGVLFADPTPEYGIFAPVRGKRGLAFFSCDKTRPSDLSRKDSYHSAAVYGDAFFTAAFDDGVLHDEEADDDDELPAPLSDGFSLEERMDADARDFIDRQSKKLEAAARCSELSSVSVSVLLSQERLGLSWPYGVDWLERVIRLAQSYPSLRLSTFADVLSDTGRLQTVEPYMSALSGLGYGEDMLDISNGWVIRYVRKACERMIDLADRFPDGTGLKARILNLAAKDVLLAQSGSWSELISAHKREDFASAQVSELILAFTATYEALGASTVSTERLTEGEKTHDIFPWINYRVFSRKK